MHATGIVLALLGVAVGLGGSAVEMGWPFLVVMWLTFIAAYLGASHVVKRLCLLTLPSNVWRSILSAPGLNRFDPVQATLTFVPRRTRPVRQVSVCLHSEAEAIIDLIVRDFIMSWYEWLSNDQFVPDEVAAALHDVVARAHGLFQHVDQHQLFREIILIGRVHLTAYQLALEHVDRKETARDYPLALAKQYREELARLVDNQPDVDGELEFLRHIADLLLGLLLPMNDLGCEPGRQILSDLLSVNLLQNVMELVIDPDWINELIVIALSETTKETLDMIESFDESPVSVESKPATEKDTEKPVAAPTSTSGQTTADKNTTDESPPQQPVAPAAAVIVAPPVVAAAAATPPAATAGTANTRPLVLARTDSPDMSESESLLGSQESVRLEQSTVVNKLRGDVIGIVGRKVTRRSTLETEFMTYSIQYKPALLWPETKYTFDTVQEVSRRYKQFDALYARLKENVRLSRSVQGIELPGKRILPLLTQSQAEDFARVRKEQLDTFLKAICASPTLRQCEEFKTFLRDGPVQGSSSNLSLTRSRTDSHILPRPLTRVFDVVTDVLRSRSHSTIVGTLPHWLHEEAGGKNAVGLFRAFTHSYSVTPPPAAAERVDVVAAEVAVVDMPFIAEWQLRCLQWQRRTELAVQSTWRGKRSAEWEDALRDAISSTQSSSSTIAPPLPASVRPPSLHTSPRDADFAVLDRRWPVATALFELGTTAVTEPTMLKSNLVQKLLVCSLGGIVDRFVCSELDELLRERRLAYVVRLLRETLWPDGRWPEDVPTPTKSEPESRAMKAEALKSLIEFLPGFLRVIVGPNTYDRSFARFLESLQNPEVNRCLAYALVNVILENLGTFSLAPSATLLPHD